MGKLLRMPKKIDPYAFWAVPTRSGVSKYVLTATPWNTEEASKARGFVTIDDLLEELQDLGADRSLLGSVRRTLEAGRACALPKIWLTPPQVEMFR